jgi:NAD(P)-dependent dehydrogenase (short-subunit alcohol dehydrogenase family)
MTVWFITGASRGFDLEIANEALSRGDRVVATVGDPEAVSTALAKDTDRLLTVASMFTAPSRLLQPSMRPSQSSVVSTRW